MAYYSSTEIREGSFLCSSDVDFYEPQNIVSDLLDNEADLKFFCEENNLKSGNIYRYELDGQRRNVREDLILSWMWF